jgi:4-alpha-glucanotransferase
VATSEPKRRPARSAGILLHPTSLPGPYGIGDLGPTAYAWVDALLRAGQSWWQVLPLGPTGYGDSPYQSFGAFAGNCNLLSPELLQRDGLLQQAELADVHFPTGRVDYANVIPFKAWLLVKAWERFRAGAAAELRGAFDEFRAREAAWLDDFALFVALTQERGGGTWTEWPRELLYREPAALDAARRRLANEVGLRQFGQFLFFRQLADLKRYANHRGIRLIGDVPIFVAGDSADVWANPELFLLDRQRRPSVVAGVPPDYFSSTGQLWGNPLYDWDAARRSGYAWWIARIRATLAQVDVIRLDHFRGFQAYWEVPAGRASAEVGRWVDGPGADLFHAIRAALGDLPLIAEDLGLITPEVEALRASLGLPGMCILQFAFSGPDNRYLPHHYEPATVAYTGTHDNDTTHGWFATLPEKEAAFLRQYVPRTGDIAWDLMREAWGSVADHAIAPLQDVLSLGTEARMNLPGRPVGNWGWRFHQEQLTDSVLGRLKDMTAIYGR